LFNTRLSKFKDVRVRQAIALAMDYEWMNRQLFYNAYTRVRGYFVGSDFEAKGLPTERELALLEPLRRQLDPGVFDQPVPLPPVTSLDAASGKTLRDNLRQAKQLLQDAGWTYREGALRNDQGQAFALEFLDSSGSMGDNQRSLVASFPGFVLGMRTQLLDAPSFHVGVTTSSDNFNNGAGCSDIGSLVTRTGGPESSNRTCGPYASGRAWMDHLDPNLEEHFACAAQVGVGGSDDERMMRGALNAVNPANTGVGACNEGFSRPDALLVMVLISDEDDVPDQCDGFGNCEDQASGGSPDEWVAELAGYRGGSTEDVVVLALVGRRPDNPCGAVVNSRLLGFARRFGAAGYVDDICAESYDGFFSAALPVIAEACAKR
jgi:hypothetical protein